MDGILYSQIISEAKRRNNQQNNKNKSKRKRNLIKSQQKSRINNLPMLSLQQTLLKYSMHASNTTPYKQGINGIQLLYLDILLNQYNLKMKNTKESLQKGFSENSILSSSNKECVNNIQIQSTSSSSSSELKPTQINMEQEDIKRGPSSPLSPSSRQLTNYMNCIIEPTATQGGIYISDYDYASNLENLEKNEIKAVLSIDRNHNFKLPDTINHKTIIVFDNELESIKVHFDKTYLFILNAIQNKQNVLIHCRRGISRSATILIAFLMKFYNKSYQESFDYLQQRRSIINPNKGFVKQLKAYEIVLKEYLYYTNSYK